MANLLSGSLDRQVHFYPGTMDSDGPGWGLHDLERGPKHQRLLVRQVRELTCILGWIPAQGH